MLPQHPCVAGCFENYFFSHENCFPHNVHLKKRSNKTFFEIVPTKNLIHFLCYFIYLFLFIFTNSHSNKFFMKITTVEMNWFRRPYVPYKLVIENNDVIIWRQHVYWLSLLVGTKFVFENNFKLFQIERQSNTFISVSFRFFSYFCL